MDTDKDIFVVGDSKSDDYQNLLLAARKAVEFGYRVYLLPNPTETRTPDFILFKKGVYRTYDLKTVFGKSSVGGSLLDSIGQCNIKFHSIGELRRALDKAIAFYNNERPHMSLNNMTPRQAASCMGKIQKKWVSYREKYLENLEIQEGACTFAPQTLNMIERLSAENIQQKQGLRENDSTSARVKD